MTAMTIVVLPVMDISSFILAVLIQKEHIMIS